MLLTGKKEFQVNVWCFDISPTPSEKNLPLLHTHTNCTQIASANLQPHAHLGRNSYFRNERLGSNLPICSEFSRPLMQALE